MTRGPGHAALALSHDAQGKPESELKLPPGRVAGRDWVPVGVERGEPQVDPVRSTARGSAADQGRGGETWQLRLPPRQRTVLQRFFGEDKR